MKKTLALSLALLLLGACNSKESAHTDQVGNCDSEVVSDYNEVMHASRMADIIRTFDKYEEARALAVELKEKYSGLVCTAGKNDSSSLGVQETSIDIEAEMDALIDRIDEVLST